MTKENAIKLFQDQRVRVHWDRDQEKWYFSIIDVIGVLTGSERPRKYWSDLKSKLKSKGSEVSEKIGQLKMKSLDGKNRMTDEIKKAWSGLTTIYINLRNLKRYMSNMKNHKNHFSFISPIINIS